MTSALAAWMALGVAGCGPRVGQIEALPVAGTDGHLISGPTKVAVVGRFAQAPELATALREVDPALVVFTGDTVARSRAADWAELQRLVVGLPVSPLPGVGEALGDPKRKAFTAAWDGLGVPGLPGEVTWRSFDIDDGSVRWRVVIVDADRGAVGDRWTDQLFWLPKVVGDTGYDHLVLVANESPATLEVGAAGASEGLAELMELVREHADSSRIVLVVGSGGRTPHAVLPGGRWGEAWLLTGSPTGPTPPLMESDGTQELADGLSEAILAEFERRASIGLEGMALAAAFEPRKPAIAGWWTLTFSDGVLDAQLRLHAPEGWWPVYTLRFSSSGGWRPL